MRFRRLFLILTVILSAFLLTGCLDEVFSKEKELKLTAKEKFELLQEFDFSFFEKVKQTYNVEITGVSDGQDILVKGDISLYSETNSENELTLLGNFSMEIDILSVDLDGEGSIFVNENKAYLNLDINYQEKGSKGSNINIKSKEVMDLGDYLTDIFMYDEIDEEVERIREEFRNLKYDEIPTKQKEQLEFFLGLIKIYKNGSQYTIIFKLTKEDISNYIDDNEGIATTIVSGIQGGSKLEIQIVVKDKKLNTISMDGDLGFVEDENKDEYVNIKFDGNVDYKPKKPSFPKSSELDKYEEVEMFSIIENIFGGMIKFPDYAE